MSSKEMETFLGTCSDAVQKHVKVIHHSELAKGVVYHISTNGKIPLFIPRIGDRQADEEDRTVPRVCVAEHLVGCMLGYNKIGWDIQNLKSNGHRDEEYFKGGWTIYTLAADEYLRPDNTLVPAAKQSDELWVVAYDDKTAQITPTIQGKFFFTQLVHKAQAKDLTYITVELLAKIEEGGVQFSRTRALEAGYYRINMPLPDEMENYKDTSDIEITDISKETYDSAKKATAVLLSYQEPPAMLRW